MTAATLHLALDTGPLYGHRTGVGVAVEGMVGALGRRLDITVEPYLLSFRSKPVPGHHRLPLPGIVASHVWSRFDHPRADRWLDRADVVHGTNYVAPPTHLPTVISVYDCWFLEHPELATPLVRRAGATLRRAVARGAWIHTSSDASAVAAARLLDTDRVVAVHLGPPPTPPATTDLRQPDSVSALAGQPFVVSIATEERRKAIPVLVQAFGLVAQHHQSVRLVLAGAPGDETAQITAAIDSLPTSIGGRVDRLGPIDDDTKQWLIRHAAVLAYPSLDEGFGFPILESQAAGTPVVASRAGSIPEIAGEAAVLIDDHDPATFAEGLLGLLSGGIGRLGLIEAGYRNVGRFSWAATAAGLVDLYRRAQDTHR
jgi:glycosyltransferase involved in cell wall biosynthesis